MRLTSVLQSPPLGFKRYFRPRGEKVFDWVISSDLLPLTDSDTPTLLHRFSGSLFSPDISFAPSLSSFPAPGRCFRTWVLITYEFFFLFLSLRSFAPTSVPLPSIFRKLAGMTLPSTLTLTILLQRNTRLLLFPMLLLSLSLWRRMRPNPPFLSAVSNSILNPGGLLRWKKRLVKDATHSLPLTEVMKIAGLTSPLPDVLHLSSPRPKLRHGRRLTLLFRLNLTLNLFTLSFILSLALLPRVPPLLASPTVFRFPGTRLLSTLPT